jgi:hypothetical protein
MDRQDLLIEHLVHTLASIENFGDRNHLCGFGCATLARQGLTKFKELTHEV